jgi:hypothetical protein
MFGAMQLMRIAVLGAALALAGCASLAAVNPDGGIVENAGSASSALKLAQTHCDKTGRTARAMGFDAFMGSLTFECVQK